MKVTMSPSDDEKRLRPRVIEAIIRYFNSLPETAGGKPVDRKEVTLEYVSRNHVESPIDGTNFDLDVLKALQSSSDEEVREKLLALKEKYK